LSHLFGDSNELIVGEAFQNTLLRLSCVLSCGYKIRQEARVIAEIGLLYYYGIDMNCPPKTQVLKDWPSVKHYSKAIVS
jgi:hypothetical protein